MLSFVWLFPSRRSSDLGCAVDDPTCVRRPLSLATRSVLALFVLFGLLIVCMLCTVTLFSCCVSSVSARVGVFRREAVRWMIPRVCADLSLSPRGPFSLYLCCLAFSLSVCCVL